MLEGHVGLPGSGKTLHATARLHRAKQLGRRAMANFHSQSGAWEFALWDRMMDASNCFCVIDEAHMWFSCRKFNEQSQVEYATFQQHRKEGMDMVWIAQHESRVDVVLRELTAFIWRHRRIGKFVIASKVTPDEPKKVITRKVVPIRPELYNDFFTEERIGLKDGTGYRFGSGDAYKRSAGGSPELDENYRLKPNTYRLEAPGHVRYLHVDEPRISEAVALALLEWRATGAAVVPEDICRPLYRGSDGRYHELDHEGALVPNEAQKDLFGQALVLLDELRRSIILPHVKVPSKLPGTFPNPPSNSGIAAGRKICTPIAAIPMVRAESVPKEGVRIFRPVARILNPGGSGS